MAIFLPWLAPQTEAGGARAAAARRPPGHDCGRREGEKKEGDEGVLLPHSPWARACCGGGSTWGGGGGGDGLQWWLDVVVRRGNGGAVVVWWCGEDGAGLFIAGMRRFGGDISGGAVAGGARAASRCPTGFCGVRR
jgi:hypothetical protein